MRLKKGEYFKLEFSYRTLMGVKWKASAQRGGTSMNRLTWVKKSTRNYRIAVYRDGKRVRIVK